MYSGQLVQSTCFSVGLLILKAQCGPENDGRCADTETVQDCGVGVMANLEIRPLAFCYHKWKLQLAEFIASRERYTESNERSVVLFYYEKNDK